MTVIRVIGCGNPEAGDDAVGVLAVRAARERLADVPGVEVTVAGSGTRALDAVVGADALIVVDAVRTPPPGVAPGTIVVVDVGTDRLPVELASSVSTHGVGLAEVVAIAAALGAAPHVVLVGVEAGDVAIGRSLSPAVGAALPALVERVVSQARRLAIVRGVRSGQEVAS